MRGRWRPRELTAVSRVADPAIGGIVVRVIAVEHPVVMPDDLIGSSAEAVPAPVLVADRSGIVVFSNSAARTLLGDARVEAWRPQIEL